MADTPGVVIGNPDGDESYLLHAVVDALRLADGRIAVANCGSADIRFYSADGTHLHTVGRRGDGPGEFRFLRRLFPAGGDSIGAFDFQHQRITLLAGDGRVGRTINVIGPVEVLGRFDDGHFVAILPGWGETSARDLPTGLFRWPDRIARLRPDGTVASSVPVRGGEATWRRGASH